MYATLIFTNPVFLGFSRYQNVNFGSQRDKQLPANQKIYQSSRMLAFMELLLYRLIHWNARNDREVAERIRGSYLHSQVM